MRDGAVTIPKSSQASTGCIANRNQSRTANATRPLPLLIMASWPAHTNSVDLPFEILDAIFGHLRPRNNSVVLLGNCALVCRSWASYVQRLLFERFTMGDSGAFNSLATQESRLAYLGYNRHLAALVTKINIFDRAHLTRGAPPRLHDIFTNVRFVRFKLSEPRSLDYLTITSGFSRLEDVNMVFSEEIMEINRKIHFSPASLTGITFDASWALTEAMLISIMSCSSVHTIEYMSIKTVLSESAHATSLSVLLAAFPQLSYLQLGALVSLKMTKSSSKFQSIIV
jgi:hypothetical protein